MLARLNLPEFEVRLKKDGDKKYIFDILRRKYLYLTPEEWVRQHFVNYLIVEKNYPKGLFRIEKLLHYHKMRKRADIIVCDRKGTPIVLVECKAPHVKITQDAFNQAATYNTQIKAPITIITNGLRHFCYKTDFSTQNISFIQDIPLFRELISD